MGCPSRVLDTDLDSFELLDFTALKVSNVFRRLFNSLGPTQLKVLSCNLCIATDAVCVSVGTTHVLPSLECLQ